MLQVTGLRTEHLDNPLGIDAERPRLSWKLISDGTNIIQTHYQIQAASKASFLDILWDSGKVASEQSQYISYDGPTLRSLERVYWRVKAWSNNGEQSRFSEPVFFEMGLLQVTDWQAQWIEPELEVEPDAYKPASYLRKEFAVRKGIVSARACLTAKGLYRFYINGLEGSDQLFTPGFTSYYKRHQYQVYDITSLLQEGSNAWGVVLGDGWWRGATGGADLKNNFGYKLAFLGQIVINYEDGSQEIISSDESFKASNGPLLKSDMKSGEIYDATLELKNWNLPGYDDSSWRHAISVDGGYEQLIATRSVPVKQKESFSPTILHTANGETVLDFGQNLAGSVQFQVEGVAGDEVILVHGEALDRDGNFTLQNLSSHGMLENFQEVHYILAGNGTESYHPQFAIFGFRYVLVKRYPGEVVADDFKAVAIYSDLEETGDFSCSNPLINKLVSNSRWSQKGNFMEVPTDCPTRERAGWTGDAQLYCRTASSFMNVYPFFEKWMADLAAEQFADGSVGSTVPTVIGYHNMEEWQRFSANNKDPMMAMRRPKPGLPSMLDGSAGWGDAAVIIPWTMYLVYGDKEIIERQYDSAKAWVEYMTTCAKDVNEEYKETAPYHTYTDGERDADYIWDTKFHWGEWLEADTHFNDIVSAMTKSRDTLPYVATAYYAYSTRLLSEMAEVLGKQEDTVKYRQHFEKIKLIYNKYFIKEDGTIKGDRQAHHVRALAFDLADDAKKQAVADHLAKLVIEQDYHLNTGFLATPFILDVLANYGYEELAFRLLEQETTPSWLYAVKNGATTIWESWRGITPEGELSGSLNHYSYGAVCNFLFSRIAGITPLWEEAGYKQFIIKPLIGGSLSHASAKLESPYGTIESSWEKLEQGVRYQFVIPVNTTATICIQTAKEQAQPLLQQMKGSIYNEGILTFKLGSGSYKFVI